MIGVFVSALLAAAAAPARPVEGPATLPIRRFALVAGVNDGGADRVRLRYARSDAERIARLLERLGGVSPEDAIVLLDPAEPALREAFRTMETRIRAARAASRAELVVYYSGHSDDQGLLLRGARIPYADVRRWLETVGADVRIAILDSCSSGALTRQKGGQRAPPFLVDTSTAVKGHAILTSSAADEASQESDRIEASFFTHFLLTGLRGAADTSRDGKVTVSEAYQFAFDETLARTERTRSGAQHPAYDIQLVGSGDVVLTDLRGTDGTLVFPEAVAGRFFVRDSEGRLVAELRKVGGRLVELGLDAGSYAVVLDDGDRVAETQLTVASGSRTVIPLDRLQPVSRELTATRGGDVAYVPVDLSLYPPVSTNGRGPTWNRLQLGLMASRTTRLRGFGFAPVIRAEEDVKGVQLGFWTSVGGPVYGLQLSVAANVAGDVRGVQTTYGVNLVRGDVAGVQDSLLANWTRGRVAGAQFSSGVSFAGSLIGSQQSLIGNWTSGSVVGIQLAYGMNFARQLKGAQVGTVNAAGEVRGVQLAGAIPLMTANAAGPQLAFGVVSLNSRAAGAEVPTMASWTSTQRTVAELTWGVNSARSLKGGQIGSVNVAGEMRGVQLGVVNVSSGPVRGWQVGIVNVSRRIEGIPLGVVNVVLEGRRRFLAVTDEDGVATLGYAGGTAHFHTTLEVSLRRTAGRIETWAGFGPGFHLERGRLSLDLDLLGRHADDAEQYLVVTARALAAFALSSHVALVAGPTANALLASDSSSSPSIGGALGGTRSVGDGARLWAGAQLGLRL